MIACDVCLSVYLSVCLSVSKITEKLDYTRLCRVRLCRDMTRLCRVARGKPWALAGGKPRALARKAAAVQGPRQARKAASRHRGTLPLRVRTYHD